MGWVHFCVRKSLCRLRFCGGWVHFCVRDFPHRVHKSAICVPGGDTCGRESGPGGRRVAEECTRWGRLRAQKWTQPLARGWPHKLSRGHPRRAHSWGREDAWVAQCRPPRPYQREAAALGRRQGPHGNQPGTFSLNDDSMPSRPRVDVGPNL